MWPQIVNRVFVDVLGFSIKSGVIIMPQTIRVKIWFSVSHAIVA